MVKAISYVRWSNPSQSTGDSLRRQSTDCQAFCDRHGLTLSPISYKDAGISAFKGRNKDKGALSAILEAIENGTLEKGTVLVVEQLDRLSRLETDEALALFANILRSGILIGHVRKDCILDKSCLKGFAVLEFIIELVLANEESSKKSERCGERWRHKKAQAEKAKLTKSGPSWLTLSDDRTYWIVDETKADVVRYIFQLCAEQGLGIGSICERLTREKVKPIGPSKEWWHTSVLRILRSRYVIGEYQPRNTERKPEGKPIIGYYPAIIGEKLYRQAQQAIDKRGTHRGRMGKNVNIFSGLIRNRCDNSPLYLNTKRGYKYLIPRLATGDGTRYTIRLEKLEKALFSSIQELVLREHDDKEPSAELSKLIAKRDTLRTKLELVQDSIETADWDSVRIMAHKLEQSIKQTTAQIDALQTASATRPEQALEQTRTIIEALADDDSNELRLSLRQAIRRLIDSIIVEPVGKHGVMIGIHYRNGEQRGISFNKQTGEYVATPIF